MTFLTLGRVYDGQGSLYVGSEGRLSRFEAKRASEEEREHDESNEGRLDQEEEDRVCLDLAMSQTIQGGYRHLNTVFLRCLRIRSENTGGLICCEGASHYTWVSIVAQGLPSLGQGGMYPAGEGQIGGSRVGPTHE